MFFLLSVKRGVGGLGQSKKFLSENTLIFLTKGGWSHPIQKGSIRFVGISYQKLGFYIKNWLFLTNFSPKRGGGLCQIKKYLSENTQIFFDQRGGLTQSRRVLSDFFGIICQTWGFYIKNW